MKLILARQDKASCEMERDVISYDSPVKIMQKMMSKVCVSVAFHQSSHLVPLQAAASLPESCDLPSDQ